MNHTNIFSLLDDNSDNEDVVTSKQNNSNNFTNKFEEEIINQFCEKKTILNTQKNKNDNFTKVVFNKKNNKISVECKFKQIENNFEEIKMDNYYKILAHHNDDKSWDYNSYYNMTNLVTWRDTVSFFNTFTNTKGECSYKDFDLFVMKNEISPMWEDKENRNGSICSIKIDSLTDGLTIFKNVVYNMCNNTLLKFNSLTWNTINGISFSSKKIDPSNDALCIIVKIWFKINILNYSSIDKLLNDDTSKLISKYSIKNKPIKPEY